MCRVKNKFGVREEALVGGYRDLMLSVVFTGASGLRCTRARHARPSRPRARAYRLGRLSDCRSVAMTCRAGQWRAHLASPLAGESRRGHRGL